MTWNFNILSEALVGQQQNREGEIITLLFKITRKTKTFAVCFYYIQYEYMYVHIFYCYYIYLKIILNLHMSVWYEELLVAVSPWNI